MSSQDESNDASDNPNRDYIQKNLKDGIEAAEEENLNVFITSQKYSATEFTQLIIDNIIYLTHQKPDYIGQGEFSLLIKLSTIIQKYDNLIIKVERKSGYGYDRQYNEPATISWIADFFNYSSRSYVSKKIKSLVEKGFIFEEKEHENKKKLYLNPEFAYKGDRANVPRKLCKMASDYNEDPLDENSIALPWKIMRKKGSRGRGRFYSRSTYYKERNEIFGDRFIDYHSEEFGNMLDYIQTNIQENEVESLKHFINTYKIKLNDFFEGFISLSSQFQEKDSISYSEYKSFYETMSILEALNYNDSENIPDTFKEFIGKVYQAKVKSQLTNKEFVQVFADIFENLYSKILKEERSKSKSRSLGHAKFLVQHYFLELIYFLLRRTLTDSDNHNLNLIHKFLSYNYNYDYTDYYWDESPLKNFKAFSFHFPNKIFGPGLLHNFKAKKVEDKLEIHLKNMGGTIIDFNYNFIEMDIQMTDVFLYYISYLYKEADKENSESNVWFPRIYLQLTDKREVTANNFRDLMKEMPNHLFKILGESINIGKRGKLSAIREYHNKSQYKGVLPDLNYVMGINK